MLKVVFIVSLSGFIIQFLNYRTQIFTSIRTLICDELLLEAGFLAIIGAPLFSGPKKKSGGNPKDYITLWLVRWLLFRFQALGALQKLINGHLTWWTLTGLKRFYEIVPLPSPLAWYAYGYLPEWGFKLSMVITDMIEIIMSLLFFIPIRSIRISSFFFQLFMQLCIIMNVNMGLLSPILLTLQLALLDDRCFHKKKSSSIMSILGHLANIAIHAVIIYGTIQVFSLKINGYQIDSNFAFTKAQFDTHIGQALIYIIYVGIFSLATSILYTISLVLFDNQGSSNKFVSLISTLFYSGIAVVLVTSSLVPIASVKPASNSTVHPMIRNSYNRLHKLHIVNHYTMYNKMPPGDHRREIIFEGADSVDGPWKEYTFLYKPGNPNSSLPFITPYTPKVDWHLSEAAYSTYEQNPWLMSFSHRILTHNPEVLSLIDFRNSPYRQSPPKYLRGVLYKYQYTDWNQRSQKAWWTREKLTEYLPVVSKDSEFLIEFLKTKHLLPASHKTIVNPIWKQGLDYIRFIVNHLETTLLFWSVLSAAIVIVYAGTNFKKN